MVVCVSRLRGDARKPPRRSGVWRWGRWALARARGWHVTSRHLAASRCGRRCRRAAALALAVAWGVSTVAPSAFAQSQRPDTRAPDAVVTHEPVSGAQHVADTCVVRVPLSGGSSAAETPGHGTPGQAATPKTFDGPCLADVHVHYRARQAVDLAPDAMLRRLSDAGVVAAFVLTESTASMQAVLETWWVSEPSSSYPVPIPWLDPYQSGRTSQQWWDGPLEAFSEDFDRRLSRPFVLEDGRGGHHCALPWAGVGEVHLQAAHRFAARFTWLLKRLERDGLPIMLHADPVVIDRAFEVAPDLRVIWAHAGPFPYPDLIADYLRRYPHLTIEVSMRPRRVAGPPRSTTERRGQDDALTPSRLGVDDLRAALDRSFTPRIAEDWETLIFEFPDRVMLGSDPFSLARWDRIGLELLAHRQWLDALPAAVQAQVARENALHLAADFMAALDRCRENAR